MWRRFLNVVFVVLPMVVVLGMSGVPTANAKNLTYYNSTASVTWNGSLHGGQTEVAVSNPSLNSGDFWTRGLEVLTVSNYIALGYVKGTNGLQFFYGKDGNNTYASIPSADIGQVCTLKEWNYYSSGGGVIFQFLCPYGTVPCASGCYQPGGNYAWTGEILVESINATLSAGQHMVWGVDWYANEYQDSGNGKWYYQSIPTTCPATWGCPAWTNGWPPQMLWHVTPGHSSIGGELYSCVYDSTVNSCTLGS